MAMHLMPAGNAAHIQGHAKFIILDYDINRVKELWSCCRTWHKQAWVWDAGAKTYVGSFERTMREYAKRVWASSFACTFNSS